MKLSFTVLFLVLGSLILGCKGTISPMIPPLLDTPTPTRTFTPLPSGSATPTWTATALLTPTSTPSPLFSATSSPTATWTLTPSSTWTPTATFTGTIPVSSVAGVDQIILNTTTVMAGCPLVIDALLHNCKDGSRMSVIVTISSQCGLKSFAAAVAGGQGPGPSLTQGWDVNNFQDVIVSSVPDLTPQIAHRYRSGVDYYWMPYSCFGVTEFKGLNLCTENLTHNQACNNGFLLSGQTYSPSCSAPVGPITYNIPPEMVPGVYYVNIGVSAHDTLSLNCWEAGRLDQGNERCQAITVVAGSCATGTPSATPTGSATPTPSSTGCAVLFGSQPTPPWAGVENIYEYDTASGTPVVTSHIAAGRYNLPSTAIVRSISAVFPVVTPAVITNGEIRFALYSDGGGSPSYLLAEATPVPYVNGQTLYTAHIPPTSLPAGNYWLAAQAQVLGTLPYGGQAWGDILLGLASLSGNGVNGAAAYGPFPATFTVTSSPGRTYQIWADDCP